MVSECVLLVSQLSDFLVKWLKLIIININETNRKTVLNN